jgi:hypothetical protein
MRAHSAQPDEAVHDRSLLNYTGRYVRSLDCLEGIYVPGHVPPTLLKQGEDGADRVCTAAAEIYEKATLRAEHGLGTSGEKS